MAGGNAVIQLQFQRAGSQRFQSAGCFVIDLIAVHVHQKIMLRSQLQGKIQGFHAVFPGKFKMRNGAYRIRSHAHRLLHQPPAVGITEDTFLGKGNYLDFHKVFHFFPELQHGFQSQQ